MKTSRTTQLGALACLAALSGCQTTQQNAALQCGAGTAAVSYLLCKAAGGRDADCLGIGVALGAGGAAICYSYSDKLEKRRKELAGREQDLNAQLTYVRALNTETEQLNADLGNRVAQVTKRTDELVAQIQAQKLTQAQRNAERQSLDREVKAAALQVNKGDEALKEAKALRAKVPQPKSELDDEIRKQEVLLAQAQRQVDLLAQQRARV
jgi:hypothetical protein